ncbi:cell envelope biogenesis protein OmpA [Maribacter algarum]|uniref:Cell envelope biogenesis protein OmpA n=2 Tax=Maribacter algarum (ex Zhang et al. 2020) TaxID=2578118 RepID=A0A5S3PZ69_9FLAO|nr:cell envelope biogenesis protein OmpA [Maribacter algarum]
MDEKDKLEILKDILLADEHEFEEKISRRIELLEQTVHEREKLSEKVNPIISHQLDDFTKNIPETLGPTITETLKKQIKINKDEVVDALYPIMGKMVKKYVAQEMKLLSEKMNNQLSFLSFFKRKFKSGVTGQNENEIMLGDLATASIQQVLLIEKDSGILKASYSKSNAMDEEMVSGMLTAIKSFVEDAFNQRNQELESIEYELYEIHLQSFATHYIAVVISGNYMLSAKNKLQDIIFDFYNSFMAMNLDLVFETKNAQKSIVPVPKSRIERELAKYFGHAQL